MVDSGDRSEQQHKRGSVRVYGHAMGGIPQGGHGVREHDKPSLSPAFLLSGCCRGRSQAVASLNDAHTKGVLRPRVATCDHFSDDLQSLNSLSDYINRL
jgi:hypothetical protein